MDIEKIKGTQLCKNCNFCGSKGKCNNLNAKKVWATNQRNGCDFFNGHLVEINWEKSIPVRPR